MHSLFEFLVAHHTAEPLSNADRALWMPKLRLCKVK
jgi:hypothetical protein